MIGQPGSVAPIAYSPSPQLSAISYQIAGRRLTSRCGSEASSAWPVALRAGLTAQALLPASRGKSASSSSVSSDSRLAMRISRSGSKSMPSRYGLKQLAQPLVVDAELNQLQQQPLVFLLDDREPGEAQQLADEQHGRRLPRPRAKAGDPHRQRAAGVDQAVVHALAVPIELLARVLRAGGGTRGPGRDTGRPGGGRYPSPAARACWRSARPPGRWRRRGRNTPASAGRSRACSPRRRGLRARSALRRAARRSHRARP